MRLFLAITAVILLASCTGAGGYPQAPEAAGAIAGVTQTAVSRQLEATAESQRATIAANQTAHAAYVQATASSFQATQNAAHAQETAVSKQATSTAVVAATGTAAYEVAVAANDLQLTRDWSAVQIEQTHAAATPTAAAILLQQQQDIARAARGDKWAVIWMGLVAWLGVVILLGLFFVFWRLTHPVEPVWNDDGDVVAVGGQYQLTAAGNGRLRPRAIVAQPVQAQPPQNNMPEPETVVLNGKPILRERKAVTVGYDSNSFRLTGRQLDKMEQWVKEGDITVRRDPSQHGHDMRTIGVNTADYSVLRPIMIGRGYWEIDGKGVRWTHQGLHDVLGIVASPTPNA